MRLNKYQEENNMNELEKELKKRVESNLLKIEEAQRDLIHIQENLCTHYRKENIEEDFNGCIITITKCPICGKTLEGPDGYMSTFSSYHSENFWPSEFPKLEIPDYIKNMSVYWMNETKCC